MRPSLPASHRQLLLGLDGGATRTVALLTDRARRLVRRWEAGPGNIRLLSDRQLLQLLRSFKVPTTDLAAVAMGMAGARTETDRARMRSAAARVWPGIPCQTANDLETALAAAITPGQNLGHDVLVLSGTGACCFGRSPDGRSVKVGGWGHLLGDRGSGYDLGLRALETVLAKFDHTGRWPRLGSRLLRKLTLNEPEDFINWAQSASKAEMAALATEVFAAASEGDPIARQVVRASAAALSANALACARRLTTRGQPVRFVLAGGMLLKQAAYARAISRALRGGQPDCTVVRLEREGAWGAVDLAADLAARATRKPASGVEEPEGDNFYGAGHHEAAAIEQDLTGSPTEQRNPRSIHLHRMPFRSAIQLFLSEEPRIVQALHREVRSIERACQLIAGALHNGGRLFYVGAGTSGRLGVLDASECPPTFGTRPDQVQGIIAGGARALSESVEGAEDDREAGARAVRYRDAGASDVVVGVAASGRTPFVWGALQEAHALGAKTVLVCFNPAVRQQLRNRGPDVVIAADIGPELLTGSTRLKAGTATKWILNLFTTLAMVRLGKTMSNLMVDLDPSNRKLRERAVRIVSALSGADAASSRQALSASGWVVRTAVRQCRSRLRSRAAGPR